MLSTVLEILSQQKQPVKFLLKNPGIHGQTAIFEFYVPVFQNTVSVPSS